MRKLLLAVILCVLPFGAQGANYTLNHGLCVNATVDTNLVAKDCGGLPLLSSDNLAAVVSKSAARTNLGLVVGTDVQAHDTDLDALAALSSSVGVLKRTGAGTFGLAVAGTDFAPATTGSSILYGNGSGGFFSVTVGTGLSFTTGTLALNAAFSNLTGSATCAQLPALTGNVTTSAGSCSTAVASLPAISGANLTSLNASNLSSGNLAAARLPTNYVAQCKAGSVAVACGSTGGLQRAFAFAASKSMTVTFDNYYVKLILTDSNGNGCGMTVTYNSATVTLDSTCDSTFVASASPASGKVGVSKGTGTAVVTITTGASTTFSNLAINAQGANITAITDPS